MVTARQQRFAGLSEPAKSQKQGEDREVMTKIRKERRNEGRFPKRNSTYAVAGST